jgi:hypothetical protein
MGTWRVNVAPQVGGEHVGMWHLGGSGALGVDTRTRARARALDVGHASRGTDLSWRIEGLHHS